MSDTKRDQVIQLVVEGILAGTILDNPDDSITVNIPKKYLKQLDKLINN